MRFVKPFSYVLVLLLAAFGLYAGCTTAANWVRDYQQQRVQHNAMWVFLTETVGTRTEGAEQKPMNRADAMAFLVKQAVEQAKAQPPTGK